MVSKSVSAQNITNLVSQIAKLAGNGQLSEAKTLCEQLSRSKKKDPQVWLMLGDINNQLQNYDKAESSYRRALKIRPSHVVAHNRLAMLFHSQGNFPLAESSYKRSLKLDNNQPSIYFNLGGVLQEQGYIDKAQENYAKAIQLKPDYAKAYANLGYIFREKGELDNSEKNYLLAVQYAPEIPEIYCNLGITLLLEEKISEAEENLNKALELKSDYADAHCALADAHVFKGEFDRANIEYQEALKIEPDSVEVLCHYANSLLLAGKHDMAKTQLLRAIDIEPDNIEARIHLGSLHILLGQHEQASEYANNILKIDPKNTKAITLLAGVEERQGNAEQAYNYLKPVLDKVLENEEIAVVFGLISKVIGREDEAIKLMETVLTQKNNLKSLTRKEIYFILGGIYDSKKSYDEAFKYYSMANNLKQINFNIKEVRAETDNLIRVYDKAFMTRMPRSSTHTQKPVFIVGMPRSGTSLVEQIISSHSSVFGAGELNDINNIIHSLRNHLGTTVQYPDNLTLLTEEKLNNISKIYLDRLAELSPEAGRVTDKLPGNYKNLGLIELMFPDARIIHCVRDPLDTCLSCYFQDFHGHHPYVYNLKHLGQTYNEYLRLMEHWKEVLSIPVLDVKYEDLVDNQEVISKKMIDFCGLEWEESCLNFYKSKRLTITASYEQVRKPMYKKSVQRWKNYEPYIGELIKEIRNG